MNAPVYLPRHGSLAERVIEWFRKNPEEELSRPDIALKFELSQSSVQACLQTAVDNGELIWVKRSGQGGVYRCSQIAAAPGPAEARQSMEALAPAKPPPPKTSTQPCRPSAEFTSPSPSHPRRTPTWCWPPC